MKKVKHFAFTSLLCLSACGSGMPAQGFLNFQVHWPQLSAFRVQVIPEATTHIEIEIFDETGRLELRTRVDREQGEQRLRLALQVGAKQVVISAKDASGRLLAESRSEVTIKQGEVSQVKSELLPLALEGDTTPSGNNPSSQPSSPQPEPSSASNNGGEVTGGEENPTEPTPIESPQVEPSVQPSSSSGGGGGGSSSGGGGGGGGGTSPTTPTLSVSATPGTLPGMGYATFVEATLSNGSTPGVVSWSCVSPSGISPCDNFASSTAKTVWTAPSDSNEFGNDTVKSFDFILTASTTVNGVSVSGSVTVNVKRGQSGTISIPSSPNAGQFDGG